VPSWPIANFAHRTACQAEETLFRVHAYFFIRDSPYFKNLLANSHVEAEVATTQETLVRLGSDVKTLAFERFLSILYPRCVVIHL
jgi:hypothetical protein